MLSVVSPLWIGGDYKRGKIDCLTLPFSGSILEPSSLRKGNNTLQSLRQSRGSLWEEEKTDDGDRSITPHFFLFDPYNDSDGVG